jgi:hypothetical protein
MIGNPNTRITLNDLTKDDCEKVLLVYKSCGLNSIIIL